MLAVELLSAPSGNSQVMPLATLGCGKFFLALLKGVLMLRQKPSSRSQSGQETSHRFSSHLETLVLNQLDAFVGPFQLIVIRRAGFYAENTFS